MVRTEEIIRDDTKMSDDDHKESASLGEVIRLQAMALARMSERMTNQEGVQPGSLPAPRPLREEGNLPVLAGDAALSEESLPVLNSFKKFLAAERRRARRRVIWVSVALGAGLMIVVGVGAWAGRERIAALRDDIAAANVRSEEARLKAAAEIKKSTDSAAAAAALLRQDLRRNVQSSHSILSSNLTTQLVGRETELEQLKEKLSTLEIENAMLASQLKELAETSRQLQENYAAWIQSGPAMATPEEEPADIPAEAKTLPLLIQSRGQKRAVQLRVPMTP